MSKCNTYLTMSSCFVQIFYEPFFRWYLKNLILYKIIWRKARKPRKLYAVQWHVIFIQKKIDSLSFAYRLCDTNPCTQDQLPS